jgi:hypothetical protein
MIDDENIIFVPPEQWEIIVPAWMWDVTLPPENRDIEVSNATGK